MGCIWNEKLKHQVQLLNDDYLTVIAINSTSSMFMHTWNTNPEAPPRPLAKEASERARNWTRFSTKGLYYIWSNEHNFELVFGFRQVGIVCAVVRCTTSQSAYYINRKGRRTCIYMHIIYILHSHRAYRKLETFETICFHRQQLCFASGFRRDFHWTHAPTQPQQSPIEFAINLRASIYLKAAIKHCICAGEVVFPRN